jgi:hypothetical protein
MAFGDFTVTRASTKLRIGSNGLYGSVANNVPAFEFNTDGSYRGLLVEPGATNLALQSQAFNEAVWIKGALGTGTVATVTANDAVAPDGTTTADLIVFNRGAGNTANDRSEITQAPTVISATTYTASVFLKAATAGDVGKQIGFRGVDQSVWVIVTLTANWTRYERASVSASTAGTILLSNRGTLTADNTVSVHAWQGQLELGSVATSPIVTTAGTASRVADVVSLTGASSLIGQSAGVIYAEIVARNFNSAGQLRRIVAVSDGTLNNRIAISSVLSQNNRYQGTVHNGGVATAQIIQGSDVAENTVIRLAIAYATDDVAFYINGSSIGTDASSAVPACSRIDIGGILGSDQFINGHIRSVALFPTRLANATLASLTA